MDILGIGTDIVECLRVRRMIEQHGELFLTRVFTDRELALLPAIQARDRTFRRAMGRKRGGLKMPRHRLEQRALLDRYRGGQRPCWQAVH